MPVNLAAIITTIQPPTAAVTALSDKLKPLGGKLLVIGDKKGPSCYDLDGTDFISLDQQLSLDYTIARLIPQNSYSRKNIGYLIAIHRGAACIYETDDDNAPLPVWKPHKLVTTVRKATAHKWVNVYKYFTNTIIWPRGFPLNIAKAPETYLLDPLVPSYEIEAPIQQGLADGAPDVDAVWRLVLGGDVQFTRGLSIWLPPHTWCPFNSQSTWWWPKAYPLMYLPSYCSFRMTDIWRSFIAQRCLWELGCGIVFHPSETFQKRNVHDLMKDFRDEIPGYLKNESMAVLLEQLPLKSGSESITENLFCCYEALIQAGYFPDDELKLVQGWIDDLRSISP